MPEYRLYEVDKAGIFRGLPIPIQADSDAEAYGTARDLAAISQEIVEIWDGPRLVWRLEPGNTEAPELVRHRIADDEQAT